MLGEKKRSDPYDGELKKLMFDFYLIGKCRCGILQEFGVGALSY